MPRASRARVIARSTEEVWGLVTDPYHLPRWWPKAERVENVHPEAWTLVYLTAKGKPVRADYRLAEASGVEDAPARRYAFDQDVEGTPFAGILRSARTEIRVEPVEEGCRVTIETAQRLRGLSRFGAPLVRRATGTQLEAALDGLEAALGAARR
jgi:uncharacterized protein YndB with AHSA1/START domain